MTGAVRLLTGEANPRWSWWVRVIGMRLASLASFALVASACTLNLGDVAGVETTTDTRSVDAFDAIALSGSVDVDVEVGPAISVEVEAAPKVIGDIETVVEEGTLQVRLARGVHVNTGRMIVRVTAPSVESISVSGSGDVQVEGLDEDSLSIAVSGSGDVEAAGEAESVVLSVSGSGDIGARALESENATVKLRGSGDISLTATDTATGSIAGSGDVSVHGGATCTIAVSGSGDVNC